MESINFNQYFHKVNGREIDIDFGNRQMYILDSDNVIISVINFSTSIQEYFTTEDLIRVNHNIGDKSYHVFENGFDNLNWLWTADIVMKL